MCESYKSFTSESEMEAEKKVHTEFSSSRKCNFILLT